MNRSLTQQPTLAVIYGNRDFFPDHLITEARADIAKVFAKLGLKAIQLGEQDSKLGGVETHAEARQCAELFRQHAEKIAGVLVCLPNFGDEKGVADTLKASKLNVPVLIQGYPDELKQLIPERRRDAFCGKISVCNNLVQAGLQFSLTRKHVSHPASVGFLNVLYNRVLNVSPETFSRPTRDRYVQSKGHSVEALYAVLADRGLFPEAINPGHQRNLFF
jgi:L-fucose isomerase-like protein